MCYNQLITKLTFNFMPKVEIYSTPTCHYCSMAKDFFKSHNVEYVDYDVQSDEVRRNEMVEKTGQMGVPVIYIDDQLVIGFDKAKLMELLGISE